MLHIQVTAPPGTPVWGGKTRTFLWAPGAPPCWINTAADEAAIAAVLPVITVTWTWFQTLLSPPRWL